MRDTTLIATLAAVIFAGCSILGGTAVDEDSYFEVSARESCKLTKDCYAAYFYSEYDDVDDCVDEVLDAADDYNDDIADNCDFDDDNAIECVDTYKSMDCENLYDDAEDIYDACSEVWDCS